jgi:hypothetical protein
VFRLAGGYVVEVLEYPGKEDFVKSYNKDEKVLMVREGGNKAGRYLEVAVYAKGVRKGIIWLPEGRGGWGWQRFVRELRQMLKFFEAKGGSLGSEAPSLKGN